MTSGRAGTSVTLILFPGGFNWPVWVARERGAFERERLRGGRVERPDVQVALREGEREKA